MDELAALTWRLLGPKISVVAGRIADLQAPLWPEEEGYVARAVPSRRSEFTAGRTSARQAIMQMGLPSVAILRGASGEPRWPAGLTGSLTHAGDLCVAAVGNVRDMLSLGIDLEPIATLEPALVQEICTPAERDWIATQPDATDLPLRIFSAKESVYKALYPLTGIIFGFAALDVRINADRTGFTACLNETQPPYLRGFVLTGGQGVALGYILSTVTVAPNAP